MKDRRSSKASSNGYKGPERRRRGWLIAMDGPAGVGKSTVGRLVAKRLGMHFLNSGEMYRALTWKALKDGVDPQNGKAVYKLARRIRWEFKPGRGAVIRTYVDGTAVGAQIRSERVSKNSSFIAAIPEVRRMMRNMQRKVGERGRIVMEGRDITTNVFPEADFKIYLDASIDERAERRHRQLKAHGFNSSLEDIRRSVRERDLKDLQRKINPLRQAPDAIVIDSTHLTLEQVSDRIVRAVRRRDRRRA
jgi:CMP/dCMP kinase